eukprot:gene31159-40515_t
MIVTNLVFQDIYTSKYASLYNIAFDKKLKSQNKYQEFNSSILSDQNIKEKNIGAKKKIAYIFAGSARSFVCDKVHWSIRLHLMDAFGGDPYAFVRIAIDDNKNIKTGHGTMWTPPYKDNEINETLKILNPRLVQHFSFSNQLEEMEQNYPGLDHAVYRQNDRRRYSMFFHRCMAYKLMLQYEKDNDIRFDWVVLVRLDALWLEPVLPISAYNPDRVWITETGFDLFNDQFMLIPRQFSDYLYDLNTKVTQDVYCLGGPDVEKWKCKRQEQEKRGLSGPLLEKTLERCCDDIFTNDRRGASERIHFRHLRNGNIPVSTARFPVALEYLFRFNGSLYPYFMPPVWPDTRGRTISSRDKVACVLMDSAEKSIWNPITAYNLHTSLNSEYKADYSLSLYEQSTNLHPSIFMNAKNLETWRIHPTFNVGGCLTFSLQHKNLSWSPCVGHVIPHQMRFDPRQLFFLQVVPESPSEYDFRFRPNTQLLPLGKPLVARNLTRVMVVDLNPRDWEPRHPIKCLTAVRTREHSWKDATVTVRNCAADQRQPSQLFHSVKGWTSGSEPFSTVGTIQFVDDPRYCVTRIDDVDDVERNVVVPGGNILTLGDCKPGGHMHQVLFEFEMIFS